jgi:hypothetical protein
MASARLKKRKLDALTEEALAIEVKKGEEWLSDEGKRRMDIIFALILKRGCDCLRVNDKQCQLWNIPMIQHLDEHNKKSLERTLELITTAAKYYAEITILPRLVTGGFPVIYRLQSAICIAPIHLQLNGLSEMYSPGMSAVTADMLMAQPAFKDALTHVKIDIKDLQLLVAEYMEAWYYTFMMDRVPDETSFQTNFYPVFVYGTYKQLVPLPIETCTIKKKHHF